MKLGVGEVGQAAGVIDVEMGRDEVADVGGAEAERLDLAKRRLRLVQFGWTDSPEGRPSRFGLCTWSSPKPVSTTTRPSVRLDQKDMGARTLPVVHGGPSPPSKLPPWGHMVAQLR